MNNLDYQFREYQPVGVDFTAPCQAATFDQRQGTSAAADDALLSRLGVSASDVLVDFGCGTGSLVCQAAKRCQRIHAVDVSAAMLAIATDRYNQHHFKNVIFHQAGFRSQFTHALRL